MTSPVDEKKLSSEYDDPKVIQAQTEDVYDGAGMDPVYQAKARLLNDALQEIGMGKYQVSLSLCELWRRADVSFSGCCSW